MPKPTRTFFYDRQLTTGVYELGGREAEHAAGSFRLGKGDNIRLIDGTGRVGLAEIQEVLDRGIRVRIFDVSEPGHPDWLPRVTLAISVPKDRRMDWLVEKCTELGVEAIIPVEFRNSVVRERPGRHAKSEKWARIAREAAKQCGRPGLPEIAGFIGFTEMLGLDADEKILLDPKAPISLASLAPRAGGRRILVAVGPEGGMAPAETEAAVGSGFIEARIAPFVLKIETAAAAVTAILMSGQAPNVNTGDWTGPGAEPSAAAPASIEEE